MIVLGIDPGLATTGYALVASEHPSSRYRVLEAGVLRTPSHKTVPARLRAIHDDVRQLIVDHGPDAMAVEDVFFNKNVSSAISVSQARGVVLLAGADLAVEDYTPLAIKRQICGHGRAQKQQIQAMVQRLLNLKAQPKPDDAADALAVALCHLLAQQSGLNRASALARSTDYGG